MARRPVSYSLAGLALVILAVGALVTVSSEQGTEAPLGDARLQERPEGREDVICDEVAEPGDDLDRFVASLDPSETGCLRNGTHRASEGISISSPDVVLTSYPNEHATLVGRLWIAREADGVTVRNLKLNGRNPDGLPSPTVNANNAVFRDNNVSNRHTGICFAIGSDRYGYASGTVIKHNRIHDCGRLPATNYDHGIYVANARGTVMRDNWIYENADRGIQLFPNADESLITGNVIDSNGQGVIISGDDDDVSEDNLVEGNVIANSTIRHNVESHWLGPVGTGNVVRDNCVWTRRSSYRGSPDGSGIEPSPRGFSAVDNLVADPLYVDRKASDYRLDPDSPCRHR